MGLTYKEIMEKIQQACDVQLQEEYKERKAEAREAFSRQEEAIRRKSSIYQKALVCVAIYALFLTIFLLWRWPI